MSEEEPIVESSFVERLAGVAAEVELITAAFMSDPDPLERSGVYTELREGIAELGEDVERLGRLVIRENVRRKQWIVETRETFESMIDDEWRQWQRRTAEIIRESRASGQRGLRETAELRRAEAARAAQERIEQQEAEFAENRRRRDAAIRAERAAQRDPAPRPSREARMQQRLRDIEDRIADRLD